MTELYVMLILKRNAPLEQVILVTVDFFKNNCVLYEDGWGNSMKCCLSPACLKMSPLDCGASHHLTEIKEPYPTIIGIFDFVPETEQKSIEMIYDYRSYINSLNLESLNRKFVMLNVFDNSEKEGILLVEQDIFEYKYSPFKFKFSNRIFYTVSEKSLEYDSDLDHYIRSHQIDHVCSSSPRVGCFCEPFILIAVHDFYPEIPYDLKNCVNIS